MEDKMKIKIKELHPQTLYERKYENGYIHIKVGISWIQEHRYLMEEYLGRKLKKDEVIHHDDLNSMNNHISNLTLFPTEKEHAHWHRQKKQFGLTQPLKTKLTLLKEAMEIERLNNVKKN
jgi:hypothetical protein